MEIPLQVLVPTHHLHQIQLLMEELLIRSRPFVDYLVEEELVGGPDLPVVLEASDFFQLVDEHLVELSLQLTGHVMLLDLSCCCCRLLRK